MRGLRISATGRLVGRRHEWSERDRRTDRRLTAATRAHVNAETETGTETEAGGRIDREGITQLDRLISIRRGDRVTRCNSPQLTVTTICTAIRDNRRATHGNSRQFKTIYGNLC